ncbi:hypothetical protein LTS18_011258 [Coniosporium uncinatum]|uniref:Uncharacterized protein n=1 Tax=Coniosporium uncinatum TaxID=93489 RepID=A0ACC3DK52_9PEZI|nr:hypothetical protein LTS18_011258 [Coniosporium uncinatum]
MSCGGPYYSRLLLNAVLFAASKFSPRADIRRVPEQPSTAGWQFRKRFRELLGEAMDESSIPTIQALVTIASSLFAVGESKSTPWLYSGIAFRMIIDLGLHIDSAELVRRGKLSVQDLECRRRVFWGAYIYDKIHSMYLGRPVSLQERDMQVPIEFMDDYEELEQWVPIEPLNYTTPECPAPQHPGAVAYSVTTFSAFCRLSVIMNRIFNTVYAETAFQKHDDDGESGGSRSMDLLVNLSGDLSTWYSSLEPPVKYQPWSLPAPLLLEQTPCPTILSLQ